MPRYGKKAGEKVEKAMHERKRGKLKSGRSGKKVTSKKQAIAIGLAEARKEGSGKEKLQEGFEKRIKEAIYQEAFYKEERDEEGIYKEARVEEEVATRKILRPSTKMQDAATRLALSLPHM
jgi:hypothetical protein